jgi:hypothetical protein
VRERQVGRKKTVGKREMDEVREKKKTEVKK